MFSRAVKKYSWFTFIRSYRDLFTIYQEMLVFQVIGQMFQILQEMSRSCMSYTGVQVSIHLKNQSIEKTGL